MINYELRCEKCDRPAEVVSRKVGRQRSGHETVKKTLAKACACGGRVVPVMQ